MSPREVTACSIVAILVAAASSGSGIAAAGAEAECAWHQLPRETRSALLTAYAQHGSNGLGNVQIADPRIKAIASACKVEGADPAHLKAVSVAIAGAAMRHGAERGLIAAGVRVTSLHQTWRTSEKSRAALLHAIRDPDHSPEAARQLFGAVAGLVRAAGGSVPLDRNPMKDPLFRLYADYFMGRALEEDFLLTMEY